MLVAESIERRADSGCSPEVREAFSRARLAQARWARAPLAQRLRILRRFRRWLADHAGDAAEWVPAPWRRHAAETLAAEVLPLLEACRFLEDNAARILRERKPDGKRPFWMGRLAARVEREPFGLVLVLGPANYPLLLPGVQTLQALAAGNGVLWKPGRYGETSAEAMKRGLTDAGLPEDVLQTLPEDPRSGLDAIRAGVDKVVLTGSVDTGRKVLEETARTLTPATMELSGVDACFVLASADVDLAADALRFGLEWNRGFTCIAPRRVFVDARVAGALAKRLEAADIARESFPLEAGPERRLRELVADAESRGARRAGGPWLLGEPFAPTVLLDVPADAEILRHDPQAPLVSVIPVPNMESALEADARCPYALGATIFGAGEEAQELARRVNAGMVVLNDVIAPTADPRLPFGGRGASGFGVTRGEEGLLEMTRPKATVERRGGFRPHLEPARPAEDRALFESYIQAVHGSGAANRWTGLRRLFAALAGRSK